VLRGQTGGKAYSVSALDAPRRAMSVSDLPPAAPTASGMRYALVSRTVHAS